MSDVVERPKRGGLAVAADERTVLTRPLVAFRGLEAHCRALAVRAGVDGRDSMTYALYGSALRSAWTAEAYSDVNVADLATTSIDEIIDRADFTICQVVAHGQTLYYGPRFLEHLAQRVLIVARIDRDAPLVTLLRMYKYAARGYAVPASQIHRVLEAVARAPEPAIDAASVLHHGGGVVVP